MTEFNYGSGYISDKDFHIFLKTFEYADSRHFHEVLEEVAMDKDTSVEVLFLIAKHSHSYIAKAEALFNRKLSKKKLTELLPSNITMDDDEKIDFCELLACECECNENKWRIQRSIYMLELMKIGASPKLLKVVEQDLQTSKNALDKYNKKTKKAKGIAVNG